MYLTLPLLLVIAAALLVVKADVPALWAFVAGWIAGTTMTITQLVVVARKYGDRSDR